MLTKERNVGINNNNDHEGKESNGKNTICNRRIEHITTATIENNRYTTKCTLDICPEKQNLVINSSKVHQHIIEAIKKMNETAAIIAHDNIRITNGNTFPNDKEHKTSFPDQRLCKVTKIMYISFTLESTLTLSQLKYGSRYNSTNGIIETLCANLAFLKMEKYNSQKEASIGFFLGINPKLTLRKDLKQKIDELCL